MPEGRRRVRGTFKETPGMREYFAKTDRTYHSRRSGYYTDPEKAGERYARSKIDSRLAKRTGMKGAEELDKQGMHFDAKQIREQAKKQKFSGGKMPGSGSGRSYAKKNGS